MYPLVSTLRLHLAIQVDTNGYMYPKYSSVLLGGYKWIQLDTTCIQLYPFRCKRTLTQDGIIIKSLRHRFRITQDFQQ